MRYLALALGIGSAFAQTATITAPASGTPTLSGDAGQVQYALTSSCSSCGVTVAAAAYYLDGNPSVPGSGELLGISRTPPYTYHWNPYYASNGTHTVYVDYLSITNSVIATSPAVAFNVANNQPQNTCSTTCSSITVAQSLVAEMGVGGADPYLFNVISFYASSGTPAMVGGARCGGVTSGGTVTCSGVAAGHTVAVFYKWAPFTATLTCSPSSGTIAYGTNVNNATFSWASQWCYAYNVASGTFTMTASGATFNGAIAFEISGTGTTNPKDVDAVTSGEGPSPLVSAGFSLGFAPANEILLGGAIWNANTTPTPGPGWSYVTNPTSAPLGVAVEVINPLGAIFGTEQLTVTVNGPNSGISKTFTAFVDGQQVALGSGITASSRNFIINTTQSLNASHQVAVRADGGNCAGCTDGTWSDMGGWEQAQTFSNFVVPSQLLMSCRECIATAGGSAVTVTGTDQNTDGSTTAATITSCAYDSASGTGTTYFTVAVSGGACVVTPTSVAGIDYITATDSNGFTRVFWPFVLASGTHPIPNFGTDGQIHVGYVSNSIWRSSSFVNGGPFYPYPFGQSGVNGAIRWGPALAALGQNTIEGGCEVPGSSQSAYVSLIASDISGVQSNLAAYGQGKLKYVHLICDSYFRTTPGMFNTIFGPASPVSASNPSGGSGGWTITPFAYLTQQYVTAGLAMGVQGVDEVGLSWGGNPLEGTNTSGIVIGTNSFSALTGNGTTCTASWPATLNDRFTGADSFIITGSGTALDYVSSTNSPIFRYSSRSATAITFPCSYTGTITSGTLQLQTYVYQAFDASGNACSPTSGQLGSGYSSGPCTQYLPYNIFSTIRGWLTSVTNFPPMDWPLAGGCCTYGIANWSGATQVAGVKAGDYWVEYVGTDGSTYLPSGKNISPLIANIGDLTRNTLNYMNRATPLIGESAGTVMDYLNGPYPAGYQIAVTSCVGNTITTATPHLIYNVIPEQTKLTVNGSGSAACDGNYYVIASPTATTLTVVLANARFSATGSGGTITFANGNSYTLASGGIGSSNSGNGPGNFAATITGTCPNTWKNNRGQTFTISGSSNSNFNSPFVGWFDNGYTQNVCEAAGQGGESYWRQVPNLSATGGTAYIIPDGWYRRGINWVSNSDSAPREMFTTATEGMIEGWSGVRAYQTATDPDSSDLTAVGVNSAMSADVTGSSFRFGGTDLLNSANLSGINPVTDFGRSTEAAQAQANPNLLASGILKYLYQSRLNSPDYGAQFEAAARSGSYGNLLMIQSFVDASITCTANLAPYLISGQPIIRFSMTWDSIQAVDIIPAGTTTDSKTCAPGEFRAYVFPVNEAAELEQPVISARLADVANATDIVVQYSYSPLSFTSPSVASQTQYQTFDCGTGNCTLPLDRSIGPIYYRLVYLDSSGRILTPQGAIETI